MGGRFIHQTYQSFQQLGDINDDLLINILDIIETVNLILYSGYDEIVDMNYDGMLDVLDIIQIINIILN